MVLERLNPENILKLLPFSLLTAMALASCFSQSSAMHWVVGGGGELATCSYHHSGLACHLSCTPRWECKRAGFRTSLELCRGQLLPQPGL